MNFILEVKRLLNGGGKIGKFVITERVITFLTRGTDALMIYFLYSDPVWGPVKSMVFVTPLYVLFCAAIIYVNEMMVRRGIDLTGIEELRLMTSQEFEKRQYIKRFASWMLKRRSTIFWVGSWFYLDPDYVTLFLQDRKRSFWTNIVRITVPSTIISMVVWTGVWYAMVRGIWGAQWMWENL